MYSLFLGYFVNLYMYRAYPGLSSGGTVQPYVYKSWYLFFLDECLLSWLDNQDNRRFYLLMMGLDTP